MIFDPCSQLLAIVFEFSWINFYEEALANNLWQQYKKIGAHLAVLHFVCTTHSKSELFSTYVYRKK